jgi:hypothetical protein
MKSFDDVIEELVRKVSPRGILQLHSTTCDTGQDGITISMMYLIYKQWWKDDGRVHDFDSRHTYDACFVEMDNVVENNNMVRCTLCNFKSSFLDVMSHNKAVEVRDVHIGRHLGKFKEVVYNRWQELGEKTWDDLFPVMHFPDLCEAALGGMVGRRNFLGEHIPNIGVLYGSSGRLLTCKFCYEFVPGMSSGTIDTEKHIDKHFFDLFEKSKRQA